MVYTWIKVNYASVSRTNPGYVQKIELGWGFAANSSLVSNLTSQLKDNQSLPSVFNAVASQSYSNQSNPFGLTEGNPFDGLTVDKDILLNQVSESVRNVYRQYDSTGCYVIAMRCMYKGPINHEEIWTNWTYFIIGPNQWLDTAYVFNETKLQAIREYINYELTISNINSSDDASLTYTLR